MPSGRACGATRRAHLQHGLSGEYLNRSPLFTVVLMMLILFPVVDTDRLSPGAGVIPAGHGCRASHRASGLSLPGPSGPAALREQRASILTQHLRLLRPFRARRFHHTGGKAAGALMASPRSGGPGVFILFPGAVVISHQSLRGGLFVAPSAICPQGYASPFLARSHSLCSLALRPPVTPLRSSVIRRNFALRRERSRREINITTDRGDTA
ncbi:hypothetical protein [Erwinia typographi]|uniref:hypothetical protein n=1 Tax=Erwinia typographi TaxID=371042 RepID=UPI0012EEB3DD|nr:hypothetical protein [Erwinia typographi]